MEEPSSRKQQDTNGRMNATYVKSLRASRMPSLPKEDYRVIVRPRGGLNLSDYSWIAFTAAYVMLPGSVERQRRKTAMYKQHAKHSGAQHAIRGPGQEIWSYQ
ncbi:hypothetical protein HPB49_006104 [Dermacentor silvarum]|uniref:Uncharacterized protein n=1 Tax=Dermacentor silvarum TaxID=543639 RepID=A0ACB8DVS8_DERSI|nr:hypothetical protein HPB49_006104 [Dermacentor silvarum]